jgi:hypothetical protein
MTDKIFYNIGPRSGQVIEVKVGLQDIDNL